MSFLRVSIDKNSHIQARIYFIFLENFIKQTWKSFNIKFQISGKIEKAFKK